MAEQYDPYAVMTHRPDPARKLGRQRAQAALDFPEQVWQGVSDRNYQAAIEGSRDENKPESVLRSLQNLGTFGDHVAEGILGGRAAARAVKEGDYVGAAMAPLTALMGGLFLRPVIKGGKLVYELSESLLKGNLDEMVTSSVLSDAGKGFRKVRGALPALASAAAFYPAEAEAGGLKSLVTESGDAILSLLRKPSGQKPTTVAEGIGQRVGRFNEAFGDAAPPALREPISILLQEGQHDPEALALAVKGMLDGGS